MTMPPRNIRALAAMLALCSVAGAQQPAQERPLPERVLVLERAVAELEARVQTRSTVPSSTLPNADIGLSSRVDQLERTLERLTVDVQGVERRADDALRQASQAQRMAEQAVQLARDASRLR